MEIAVLIQPTEGRFTVSGCSVEAVGATREEALAAFENELHTRFSQGAELVKMKIDPTPRWLRHAGTLPENDPLVGAWKQAVEDYRKQVDEAEVSSDDYFSLSAAIRNPFSRGQSARVSST